MRLLNLDVHLPSFLPTLVLLILLSLPNILLCAAEQLQIEVTKKVECTRPTQNGDSIKVHYKGTLQDGKTFDESYSRGQPFTFTLGMGQVIKGWDQGLLGMCVGEQRRLTIPSSLAYGNEAVGTIPAGSTLVFETQLMGIVGVKEEAPPSRPAIEKPHASSVDSKPTSPSPTAEPAPATTTLDIPASSPIPVVKPTTTPAASPMDSESDNGECHLLGPYALLVQGALGLLAVTALVVKRWRESPRRPVKIWFFDVSKQVFGSALLHLANVLMSMLSSGKFDVAAKAKVKADDGTQPNPCSFYLLNLGIDTTIGIPILVVLLRLLHALFLRLPFIANPPESIRSGNYGHPPRATWWLKQSFIYFLGLLGMKTCVFLLFQLLPWLAWVGDWALRWTEGNEAVQITFVMFVFPLIMNAVQYWIIDGFIKEQGSSGSEHGRSEYVGVAGEEDSDDDGDDAWLDRHRRERRGEDDVEDGGSGSDVENVDAEPLKEANPTTVPVRRGSGKARIVQSYADESSGSR